MSRAYAFAGICMAGGFGVLIVYASFRPELERYNAEKRGQFAQQHGEVNDKAISQAIISDFREARQQLEPTPSKGFAWGIREAIFGAPKGQQAQAIVKLPERSRDEMKEGPQEVVKKVESADREGR